MSNPIPARVRVRTHPPLPSFQAWMIIDPNQSIHTFKQSISDLIPKSEERPKYSPDDLSLESQGLFAILSYTSSGRLFLNWYHRLFPGFAFLNQCPCSVIDVVSFHLGLNSLTSFRLMFILNIYRTNLPCLWFVVLIYTESRSDRVSGPSPIFSHNVCLLTPWWFHFASISALRWLKPFSLLEMYPRNEGDLVHCRIR